MRNKNYSYAKFEREFLPGMRKKICTCEDTVDLGNHFNCTMANLLSRIFENSNISIERDDIIFTPESGRAYRLSSKLLNNGEFREKWDNSDLKSVINRFSHAATHRYVHIKKKNIKAEKKLRN
jgi:hypothetical protein